MLFLNSFSINLKCAFTRFEPFVYSFPSTSELQSFPFQCSVLLSLHILFQRPANRPNVHILSAWGQASPWVNSSLSKSNAIFHSGIQHTASFRQEITHNTAPILKEILKLFFMSNYVTCLNSLNSTHKPVFCIRYFKVPRDLGQALQQNCWQILAYQGFQQYFLSPPKGSFPDVFPVL